MNVSRRRLRAFRAFAVLVLALAAHDTYAAGQAAQAPVIELDVRGRAGRVAFDHGKHDARIQPGAGARFKAKAGAACIGCHHTTTDVGTPQLWKCKACHGPEGYSKNPKSVNFDEVWSRRAFHDLCITCHRASGKGPVTCGACHRKK